MFEHPEISVEYLEDERFACQAEMKSLVTTTHLIVRDLYELFDYVEPCDANLSVYSHRIYELFLRTATEFESNCKGILKANGYTRHDKDMSIKDYFKIAPVAKLPEYKVTFQRWSTIHEFSPFFTWNTASYAPLPWYQGYNNVKHDRYNNFSQASFENLMNAISGLLCILHAQIGSNMINACFEGFGSAQQNQVEVQTDTFVIKSPAFMISEYYDFTWDALKKTPNPIQKYVFR